MAIVGATMQIAFWSIIIPVAILVMRFLFSEVFYIIGILFFGVIDILQSVFRKLAGLDVVYYGSKAVNGDILTSILRSQIVMDTMIAVAVFAIALVIIATIVQMIRTEYTTEGSKNSKESIFAKGLKSLVMFILIPVVCFFGIRVSNYLLQAIDYATSSTGSRSLSGAVFAASVVDANRISANMEGEFSITDITIVNLLVSLFASDKQSAHMGSEGGRVFVKGFKETLSVADTGNASKNRSNLGKKIDELMTMPSDSAKTANSGGYGDGILVTGKLNYMNITAVSFFYAFSKMNFLIMYVGAFMVLQALFNASMGMVVRMYKVTALFILAPAAIGLQPLDDGAAYKKWRTGFISNVLSAYGVIIALNLFFAIAGVVSGISLWDPENPLYYTLNKFMQALFVVVGATQIKGLAKMIGDMIGAANAMEEGQAAVGEVGKLAASAGKFAGGVAKGGAYFANKGKAMASRIQAARTQREINKNDNDSTITDKVRQQRREALTSRLDTQEARRQLYSNRASGILSDSGAGKMFDSLTGGVKGVINNKIYKGYDAQTIEDLGKDTAMGKIAQAQSEEDGKTGKKRLETVRNFAGSGGLTGAAALAAGAGGFIGGTVSGAIQSMRRGSRVGEALSDGLIKGGSWAKAGAKATFNKGNTIASVAYDGDGTVGLGKFDDTSAESHIKIDAKKTKDDYVGVARRQNQSTRTDILNSAERANSTMYQGAKADFDTKLASINSDYGSRNYASMLTNVVDLKSNSVDGSSVKELASALETLLTGITTRGGATADELAQLSNLMTPVASGAGHGNYDELQHEYGAMNSETKAAMETVGARKLKIDEIDANATSDIEAITDDKSAQKFGEQLAQELGKNSEESALKMQQDMEQALASGVMIRGSNGDALKIDSKQFVDAIKDLKASVEAQNMAGVQKDTLKTMQDMLKELKKKK